MGIGARFGQLWCQIVRVQLGFFSSPSFDFTGDHHAVRTKEQFDVVEPFDGLIY